MTSPTTEGQRVAGNISYVLCTAARAPVCLLGLTAMLLRYRALHRIYLTADTWLCTVGRIGDDGKFRQQGDRQ